MPPATLGCPAESCAARITGSAPANRLIRSYFVSSRAARHFGWYRLCFRPRASRPVACRCPFGHGEIHTCSHAGGITSDLIRPSVSSSFTGLLSQ